MLRVDIILRERTCEHRLQPCRELALLERMLKFLLLLGWHVCLLHKISHDVAEQVASTNQCVQGSRGELLPVLRTYTHTLKFTEVCSADASHLQADCYLICWQATCRTSLTSPPSSSAAGCNAVRPLILCKFVPTPCARHLASAGAAQRQPSTPLRTRAVTICSCGTRSGRRRTHAVPVRHH